MTADFRAPEAARSWPLAALAAFTVVMPAVGAAVLVWANAEWLPPLRAAELRLPLFVVAGALLAGLSLLPTHAVSLVAGMLFGAVFGTLAAMASIAAAALLGFVVLRPFAGPRTTAWLANRPRAGLVQRALLQSGRRRAASVIALVRLSPVMPFALTNLLMAALGAGAREYTLGSVLGLLPRVALVAVAGDGLAELDLSRASDRTTLILGVAGTLLALALIGRLARRALASARAVGVTGP